MTFDELKADPLFTEFATKAHAVRMNNAQMNLAIEEFYTRVEQFGEGAAKLDDKAATAELQKHWKTPEEFKANLRHSYRATDAAAKKAGLEMADVYKELGNNPTFMRLMASFGPELGEDVPVINSAQSAQGWESQAADIKADPAYNDKAHPKHKEVLEKMKVLYAKRYPEPKQ